MSYEWPPFVFSYGCFISTVLIISLFQLKGVNLNVFPASL